MILTGGYNVYPAEVEAVLVEHPDLGEGAVGGRPDERWGEVGKAFVVAADGAPLDPASLRAYCGERLARYKVPKTFELTGALPRTGANKIDKKRLREL